jgi:hypothetical protein
MSGRGRGRDNYGGRRSRGRVNARTKGSNSGNKNPGRKSIQDYVYYIGSAKQASDFVVITKYLINHIRKTYRCGDDIGTALEEREPINFSTMMP